MKATIEYNLDNYCDKLAHRRAVNSTNAYLAIYDILGRLRRYRKHELWIQEGGVAALPEGPYELNEFEAELLQHLIGTLEREISNILDDNNVDMDDLE